MNDPRIRQLARLLVTHSCNLLPGEKVLIEAINAPIEVITALIQETTSAGGIPIVTIKNDQVIRELCRSYDDEGVRLMAECELHTMRQVDAFIGVRGFENIHELADVPAERMRLVLEHYIRPVHFRQKHDHTKWVALRWPTPAMAQRAEMSTEAFEDFYFQACTLDYVKMEAAAEVLSSFLRETDMVHILGPGDTDLRFSIRGMPHCTYAGRRNVPDGEFFVPPVRDSVNGRIRYNVSSVYYGSTFDDVCFDFLNGKIIHAACNDTAKLNEILNLDEGARYVGEFAFGFNPFIVKPMRDILFDEKISGSIHLTPGNAYRNFDNGNRSSIHWDLVLMQTPEMGGGEIYCDNILVRKNGLFVLPELRGLNPKNLK